MFSKDASKKDNRSCKLGIAIYPGAPDDLQIVFELDSDTKLEDLIKIKTTKHTISVEDKENQAPEVVNVFDKKDAKGPMRRVINCETIHIRDDFFSENNNYKEIIATLLKSEEIKQITNIVTSEENLARFKAHPDAKSFLKTTQQIFIIISPSEFNSKTRKPEALSSPSISITPNR